MSLIRNAIRFKAEDTDFALIEIAPYKKEFTPICVGLIINESYSGCALVLKTSQPLNNGQEVKVKVGKLPELVGKVAWIKPIEDSLIKIGIQYIE